MSSKKKVILTGLFLILLTSLSLVYISLPKIKMEINGNKLITLTLGEEYTEKGASSEYNSIFKNKELDVEINGKVNSNKVGKYIITYKTEYSFLEKEMIRIVNVVDNTKPKIKLINKVVGCKKNNLIEYKLEAIDNYDGNITDNVKYQINDDKIIFTVSDSSNNTTKLEKKINYIDNEKPKITLKGSKNINLSIGEEYEEYGAEAFDLCDGDLTQKIKIEHNIDVNTPGIYEVNYIVRDSNNMKTIVKRYVTILQNEEEKNNEFQVINGATIYLTFDDGPGPYTEELLNILDEYNIKVTFFVTAQFPEYMNLISEEYKRGHSVGIHTYSHKWSIYQSVDDYLADFYKIEKVVYDQTGNYSKIFRFPGGSSNTVSRNYSQGIMTKLTKLMEENEYIYFDWTFDSGDTSKKNNSVEAIIKNVKSNLKGDGEYIILMHDIKENTVRALPEIIKYALANGYEFDKITENTPVKHFKVAN